MAHTSSAALAHAVPSGAFGSEPSHSNFVQCVGVGASPPPPLPDAPPPPAPVVAPLAPVTPVPGVLPVEAPSSGPSSLHADRSTLHTATTKTARCMAQAYDRRLASARGRALPRSAGDRA